MCSFSMLGACVSRTMFLNVFTTSFSSDEGGIDMHRRRDRELAPCVVCGVRARRARTAFAERDHAGGFLPPKEALCPRRKIPTTSAVSEPVHLISYGSGGQKSHTVAWGSDQGVGRTASFWRVPTELASSSAAASTGAFALGLVGPSLS